MFSIFNEYKTFDFEPLLELFLTWIRDNTVE